MIGERLKEQRKKAGKTQKEVADAIGIQRVTYNRYENGERRIEEVMLNTLANYYHCTADYLLGRTDSPEYMIWEDLPEKLKASGIEAIEIVKEILDEGIAPKDIKDIIALAKRLQKEKPKD